MAKNSEKHTPYFKLKESFEQKHCSICYLARQSVTLYLDDLLYERVTDPGTVASVRASEGFCESHFHQIVEFQDATGLSALARCALESIVEKWTQSPKELRKKNKSKALCPACETWNHSESNYISLFLENLEDLPLMLAHERSFGFCIPHFKMIYPKIESEAHREKLLKTQIKKMESLIKELAEFEGKHTYERHGENYGEEADSRFRAIEFLKGRSDKFHENK